MFIHWGLYAVPAGEWKGTRYSNIGEWIQFRANIPVAEYEQLAKKFNPVKFDAEEWVRVAKYAGMKYLVITAKHHDGFAMYNSPCNKYNIVGATPYGKDPMAALARACKKHHVTLCFYYSQAQDWHDPNGAMRDRKTKVNFSRYFREKCLPQVRELLTQYGPVGLMWFDTPFLITKRQALELKRLVHRLQPNCAVSGRIGHGVGDYQNLDDNQVPAGRVKGDWECPATMNDTWGFKHFDHNWKSTEQMLRQLVDLSSKGINYLLNVGPDALGRIPDPSVKRLREIGKWIQRNGDAIYGTGPSPYPYEFDWGRITTKGRRLYLLIWDWKKKLVLAGLRSKLNRATVHTTGQELDIAEVHDTKLDQHRLEIILPSRRPDRYVSVIALDLAGQPDVDTCPIQGPGGKIHLPVNLAKAVGGPKGIARIDANGCFTVNWTKTGGCLRWRCRIARPGRYAVKAFTISDHVEVSTWEGGHGVEIEAAGQTVSGIINGEEQHITPRTMYYIERGTKLGEINIDKPCTLNVILTPTHIDKKVVGGLNLSLVRFEPL